jgi:hypothetical protein
MRHTASFCTLRLLGDFSLLLFKTGRKYLTRQAREDNKFEYIGRQKHLHIAYIFLTKNTVINVIYSGLKSLAAKVRMTSL